MDNKMGPSSQSIRLHDLLTPLNHIMGFADLLLEELDGRTKQEIRADIEKIRSAADRMLSVIQVERTPFVDIAAPKLDRDDLEKASGEAEGSILVVDDEPNNRALIVRNLKKRGYDVTEAADGAEALSLVRANRFDLVLSDIVMPQMDGVEFLKHMQAEYGEQIPVMVISALDQMDMVDQCMDLDAVDFISKPFEPYMLLAKVRAHIRRKRRRDLARASGNPIS